MSACGAQLLAAACLTAAAAAQDETPATGGEPRPELQDIEPEFLPAPGRPEPPRVADEPAPDAHERPRECVPACRRNFVCVDGRCVSECNPPCGAGERCEARECIPREPPFPAVPAQPWPGDDRGLTPYEPRAHRHKGFFLRLNLGLGGAMLERDTGPWDVELSGITTYFSVDVGGAPVENLILHARFSNAVLSDPELDAEPDDGADTQDIEEDLDASLSFVLLGGGITYYIMPINVFVTLAGGAVEATISDEGFVLADSDLGYGIELDLGKEWWVAPSLGIGLAGRLLYVDVPPDDDDGGSDDHLRGFAAAALFSATFN